MEWATFGCCLNDAFIQQLRACSSTLEEQSTVLVVDEKLGPCPALPTENQFKDLKSCRVFEDTIDAVAMIQRQLRQCNAWISMMRAKPSVESAPNVWEARYRPANDTFVGVWINDATEEQAAWLLLAAVPAFIVHRSRINHLKEKEATDWIDRDTPGLGLLSHVSEGRRA
ncbi:hypothetical protein B0H14DRAFT_3445981 [Mycena olivaceomarginata]|nr:hypothetical protein B0H14DRAFT_3445981 [Mycena olivaceomarginata]